VGTFSSISKEESKMSLFESQLGKLWKSKLCFFAFLLFVSGSSVRLVTQPTVFLNLPDGKVPVDETTKERKILTYSVAQLVVTGVLAVFGLLYSIFLLYFNISKRNHK
jgi:hypothetical protein